MTFQPAYYNGRRYHVMRAQSHPCNYVYVFVRQQRISATGVVSRNARLRLAHTEAYWRTPSLTGRFA